MSKTATKRPQHVPWRGNPRPAATVPANNFGYPCHPNLDKTAPLQPYVETDSYDLTPLYGGPAGVAARAARIAVRSRMIDLAMLTAVRGQMLEVLADLEKHVGRRFTKKVFQDVSKKLSGVVCTFKQHAPSPRKRPKAHDSQLVSSEVPDNELTFIIDRTRLSTLKETSRAPSSRPKP